MEHKDEQEQVSEIKIVEDSEDSDIVLLKLGAKELAMSASAIAAMAFSAW